MTDFERQQQLEGLRQECDERLSKLEPPRLRLLRPDDVGTPMMAPLQTITDRHGYVWVPDEDFNEIVWGPGKES